MFTGIIEATAAVRGARREGGDRRVRIECPRGWKLSPGQSVAVDGICSTVAGMGRGYFEVEYVPETLGRTTAGEFAVGRVVNLERPLRLRDFVGGHLVAGHVDARARVEAAGTGLLTVAIPAPLSPFVAPQGSVAINGASLTVARKSKHAATVALIPRTFARTNLGALKKGGAVNLEVDLLARYAVAARGGGGRVSRNAARRNREKPEAGRRIAPSGRHRRGPLQRGHH